MRKGTVRVAARAGVAIDFFSIGVEAITAVESDVSVESFVLQTFAEV